MSTPPPAPAGSALTGAIVWTLGALVLAVFAFVRGSEPGEKQTFYLIVGAIASIAVLMNGYGAWQALQRSKSPPGGRGPGEPGA
jgi:hypothetical protein